jgi:hypothetical protein
MKSPNLHLATICALKSTQSGIAAFVVTRDMVTPNYVVFPPDRGNWNEKSNAASRDVSNVWLSDIITEENPTSATYIWSFELFGGKILSWSVPSSGWIHAKVQEGTGSRKFSARTNHSPRKQNSVQSSHNAWSGCVDDGSPFSPSVAVTKPGAKASLLDNFFGSLSFVGNSSMWMHDSVNQSHTDLFVGCVPGSDFGCVLRVGQGSRNLHRKTSDSFDNIVFRSGLLDHEVYCLGDTVVTTPAYTISMANILIDTAVFESAAASESEHLEGEQDTQRKVRSACQICLESIT